VIYILFKRAVKISSESRFRPFPKRNCPPALRAYTVSQNLYTVPNESYGEESRMEILRNPERRSEPRSRADLALTVWGVDSRGERFLQQVNAREISLSGALLSGLATELRSGDVIGILYAGKKARYRVVWVGRNGSPPKVQAAVHRFATDECPWKDLLAEESACAAALLGTEAL